MHAVQDDYGRTSSFRERSRHETYHALHARAGQRDWAQLAGGGFALRSLSSSSDPFVGGSRRPLYPSEMPRRPVGMLQASVGAHGRHAAANVLSFSGSGGQEPRLLSIGKDTGPHPQPSSGIDQW